MEAEASVPVGISRRGNTDKQWYLYTWENIGGPYLPVAGERAFSWVQLMLVQWCPGCPISAELSMFASRPTYSHCEE